MKLISSCRNTHGPIFLRPNDGPLYVPSPGSCLDFMPAAFLSGAWHQEVGCLLNQAEVNIPSGEKGGNIPQTEQGICVQCECSANRRTRFHCTKDTDMSKQKKEIWSIGSIVCEGIQQKQKTKRKKVWLYLLLMFFEPEKKRSYPNLYKEESIQQHTTLQHQKSWFTLLNMKFCLITQGSRKVKHWWCDTLIPVQLWWRWHLLATDNCLEFHTDEVKCICTCLCVCVYIPVCMLFIKGGACSVTQQYSIHRTCERVSRRRCGQRKCGTGKCWTSTEGRGSWGWALQ